MNATTVLRFQIDHVIAGSMAVRRSVEAGRSLAWPNNKHKGAKAGPAQAQFTSPPKASHQSTTESLGSRFVVYHRSMLTSAHASRPLWMKPSPFLKAKFASQCIVSADSGSSFHGCRFSVFSTVIWPGHATSRKTLCHVRRDRQMNSREDAEAAPMEIEGTAVRRNNALGGKLRLSRRGDGSSKRSLRAPRINIERWYTRTATPRILSLIGGCLGGEVN